MIRYNGEMYTILNLSPIFVFVGPLIRDHTYANLLHGAVIALAVQEIGQY